MAGRGRSKSKGSGGIIGSLFNIAMLLAIVMLVLGTMADGASNQSAEWVLTIRATITAFGGTTTWFGILIVAYFGGMAYNLISSAFAKN